MEPLREKVVLGSSVTWMHSAETRPRGGKVAHRMKGEAPYDVVSVHAIAARAFADVQWLPVRSTLGIGAFGVNAYTASAAGQRLIEEHDEGANGHEELYVVIAGSARFTVDGEPVEAPTGTCIAIHDPAVRRTAVALEPGTIALVVGAPRGGAYAPTAWERSALALLEIQEGRADVGLAGLRAIVEEDVDGSPWRRYDYACGLALAGRGDEAMEQLRLVVAAEPEAGEAARTDPDFTALHDHDDWQRLTGG